jgi:hypothetical protein
VPADEPLNLQIDGHAFRRVEVMTGSPRRRNWIWEQKAQIVSDSLSGVRPISELALRYGVHSTLLGRITPASTVVITRCYRRTL